MAARLPLRAQIDRITHDPESLPPAHRAIPGGPASVLVDHPAVIGVINEVIGPEVRVESCGAVWREQGQKHGGLHGGGPSQIDPIFGYRCLNGKIHAGMVRVIFEFTDINEGDGATHFIAGAAPRPAPCTRPVSLAPRDGVLVRLSCAGSHKANFPMHESHLGLELEDAHARSKFLRSYTCPAVRTPVPMTLLANAVRVTPPLPRSVQGSAVFFSENTCHAGPVWKPDHPRVTILHAYSHLATHWHRLNVPPVVLQVCAACRHRFVGLLVCPLVQLRIARC